MDENNFKETNLENGGEMQGDGTNGDLAENMEEVEQPSRWKRFWFKLQLFTILFAVVAYFGKDMYDKNQTKQYKKELYEMVKDNIRKEMSGAANLRFEKFDEKRVNLQRWDYYTFNHGELRYARYAVTVPCEYDAPLRHLSISPTINVYYYPGGENEEGEYVSAHYQIDRLFDFGDYDDD